MINLSYRKDIDGLRAVAILAVMLSHLNVAGFAGGFVGVDIFFVISGFLITNIILNKPKEFSVSKFYERRIRRIFPALFIVIIFVMITGAFVSNFRAFKELGQSVVAATFFSSNILFWYKGGYFAASSLEKPLLHTWSLAVEEQFYLFFPILLIAINRFLNGKYLRVLLGLGFISLIGSIWGVYAHPEATYYFTPTRMWELIVGSIIALGAITPLKENIERNFVGTVGLALIFYSRFFCYVI